MISWWSTAAGVPLDAPSSLQCSSVRHRLFSKTPAHVRTVIIGFFTMTAKRKTTVSSRDLIAFDLSVRDYRVDCKTRILDFHLRGWSYLCIHAHETSEYHHYCVTFVIDNLYIYICIVFFHLTRISNNKKRKKEKKRSISGALLSLAYSKKYFLCS